MNWNELKKTALEIARESRRTQEEAEQWRQTKERAQGLSVLADLLEKKLGISLSELNGGGVDIQWTGSHPVLVTPDGVRLCTGKGAAQFNLYGSAPWRPEGEAMQITSVNALGELLLCAPVDPFEEPVSIPPMECSHCRQPATTGHDCGWQH